MDKQDKEFEAYLRQFRLRQPGPPPEIASASRRRSMGWLLAAAVVVLAVGISAVLVRNSGGGSGPKATVEAAGSPSLYRAGETIEAGQVVHSNSAVGLMLALEDGSRIELREQSELKLEAAGDGIRVRLNDGSVMVTAAKQGAGHHLYVQTRDALVSVVGTVFLVRAEQVGTTVAVVEGEVHVQQGADLKKLLPGEQLATNPSMQLKPVAEQISWSRNAAEYVALLQQPATPAATLIAEPVAAPPIEGEPEATRPAQLPFKVQANYVRVTTDEVRTLITVQVLNRDLAFQSLGGAMRARFHIEGEIYRIDNRRLDGFSQDMLQEFPSSTFAANLDKPILFQETRYLTPGKYKVHITVEDKNSQNSGVLDYVLNVPRIPDPLLQSEPTLLTSGKQIFDRECTSCHNADVAMRPLSYGQPVTTSRMLASAQAELAQLMMKGLTPQHPDVVMVQAKISVLLKMEASIKNDYSNFVLSHLSKLGRSISGTEFPALVEYGYAETVRRGETQSTAVPQDRPVTPPASPVQPNGKKEDPDVAGARILNSACTTCHDLGPVNGRKEDRASWERIVNGMIGYGSVVKDSEIQVLLDYLFRHFGTPTAGARILNSACTTCHDLGPVNGRKEDRASWERIVNGMIGYGASVRDSEIPVLVDYLFQQYGPPKEAPAPPVRQP